jgi:hypothetical protein
MHFEFLVEGQSERTALEPILTKILGKYNEPHTWRIHKHRGIGKLPDDLNAVPNRADTSLLHNLPSRLRAYGNSLVEGQFVIALIDLDDHPSEKEFLKKLKKALETCSTKPPCSFLFAVEELEAWYFGDLPALLAAYPNAKRDVISSYIQDSQVGTWEILADAIYQGGSRALKKLGTQGLDQKRIWAKEIAPRMDVLNNQSPSFCRFRDELLKIAS